MKILILLSLFILSSCSVPSVLRLPGEVITVVCPAFNPNISCDKTSQIHHPRQIEQLMIDEAEAQREALSCWESVRAWEESYNLCKERSD